MLELFLTIGLIPVLLPAAQRWLLPAQPRPGTQLEHPRAEETRAHHRPRWSRADRLMKAVDALFWP